MKIVYRKATESDIAYLMALRKAAMDEHLRKSGASTSEEDHFARLMKGFEHAQIMEVDGVPIGLLKVVRQAPAWELIQIQLDERYRGAGLGSQLLNQVIAEARSVGCDIKLSVLKANPAKNLYERCGFRIVGQDEYEYHMYRSAA